MLRILRLSFLVLIFILIVLLAFGVFLSRYDLRLNNDVLQSPHKKYFDYKGITHVLTSVSLGGSTPIEMIAEANKAQIDFLYITDYNDFNPDNAIFNYNNDVAVFTGKKLSYLDSHFLIYSDTNIHQIDSIGSSHAVLSDYLNKMPAETPEAVTIMAHPFKAGHEWSQDHYPSGLQGIEVMNLRHMWQQKWNSSKVSFVWSCLLYLFNPKIALLRLVQEPERELALWDKLSQQHKTLGLLGSHATGRLLNLGPLAIPFPRYEDSFRFGSNHLLIKSELTGVYALDSEKIHSAFKAGHFYFALDSVANPKGFAAYIKSKDKDYSIGDSIPFSNNLDLIVDIPKLNTKSVEVRIYKNGIEIHKSNTLQTVWRIDSPGVYRAQVRVRIQLPIPGELRWIPWIYTNNFYIE